jgi:hypothetical protein
VSDEILLRDPLIEGDQSPHAVVETI